MSFDIVAPAGSRPRMTHPWKHALQVGAQLGLANFMLALVGILGMFNNRPIIVGVLTLGYATLGLVLATAGILVARRRPLCERRADGAGGGGGGAFGGSDGGDPADRHEPHESADDFRRPRFAALQIPHLLPADPRRGRNRLAAARRRNGSRRRAAGRTARLVAPAADGWAGGERHGRAVPGADTAGARQHPDHQAAA